MDCGWSRPICRESALRVQVDIAAVSVTIEDDEAFWTLETLETMIRIARQEAIATYKRADAVEDFSG